VRFLLDIRDEPLQVDECLAFVADPSAGGVDLFLGAVRDDDGGRRVTSLEYSAHPTALEQLSAIAHEVADGVPVVAVAAIHRVGKLAIGDAAVIVAVSAVHRGEAFDACRMLIDRLKHEVPIWKHQLFTDGTAEWVAAC
jgi:molybdopterin synthase catalytic subunit